MPFLSQQPAAQLLRKTARQQWKLLALNLGSSLVEAFSEGATLAVQKAAVLAAERKRQGRPVDLRDTLIAGIALAHEAQSATRNVRHFSDTTLSLINPFPPME